MKNILVVGALLLPLVHLTQSRLLVNRGNTGNTGNPGNHGYSVNGSDLYDHEASWDIGALERVYTCTKVYFETQWGMHTWIGNGDASETDQWRATVTWNATHPSDLDGFQLSIVVVDERGVGEYASIRTGPGLRLRYTSNAALPVQHPGTREVHVTSAVVSRSALEASEDDQDVIDLMMLYTERATKAIGGDAATKTKLVSAVAVANSGLRQSKVDFTFRLVHAEQADIDDTASYGQILTHLHDNQAVKALRNKFGADIVQLVVDNKAFCGMSYQMRGGAGASFEKFAYSVVNYACMSTYSHVHELGHVIGANHDADNCGSTGYPDNFAQRYCFKGGFRTVMSYPCDDVVVPRLLYFSNPNVTIQRHPTGVLGKADNVRVLNQNAKFVERFRSSATLGAETPGPAEIPETPVSACDSPEMQACALLTSVGDRSNGVFVFYDASCVAGGGIGCGFVNPECRLCKNPDSLTQMPYVPCPTCRVF